MSPESQTYEKLYLTVNAHSGESIDTKTAFQPDGSIFWTPNDAINLFYGDLYSGRFYSVTEEVSASSVFNGYLNVATGTSLPGEGARKFWAVYPYNSSNTCDGTGVTLTIPSRQRGVPGTFANKLNPTVATADGLDLAFYNVGSWFKFTVYNNDIASVTFKGNAEESIAGKLRVTMSSKRPVSQVLEGKKRITVTPAEGDVFVPGEEYCIVLIPQTLSSGYTVTYTKTDGTSASFVKTGEAEFERSYSRRKVEGDMGLLFVDGGPEGDDAVEDLSEMGTANSYIVSTAGTYKFKAVQGNSNTPVSGIQGVKVLWESFGTNVKPTAGDIINPSVTLNDGYISFSTNETFREGNALIAAYSDAACSDGNVLWSWHIWCTDEPDEQVYHNYAGTMMDRNLGATSATPGDVGAIGLLYQWGRKDPFLGANGIKSNTVAASVITTPNGRWPSRIGTSEVMTIEYTVSNPATVVGLNSLNQDWFYTGSTLTDNTRWGSAKTKYDPCPPGWRVPDGGKDGLWATAWGTYTKIENGPYNSTDNGYQVGVSSSVSLGQSESVWYPFTGYYSFVDGSLSYVTTAGLYWTCTPCEYDARAFVFYINSSKELHPANELQGYRATAAAVRCVRD